MFETVKFDRADIMNSRGRSDFLHVCSLILEQKKSIIEFSGSMHVLISVSAGE